ncbi:MAG: hypothetical protein HYX71_10530 [Opitutae bacterium]|nr:hypothetical protein [Opitutae bacterium]
MSISLPRVFSSLLVCFSLLLVPARAEALSTDKAPDIAAIPTGLPADQTNALLKQLADLAALRSAFGGAQANYNSTPRTGIVVGSAQEANLNSKIAAVNQARAAYISAVRKFNRDVAKAVAAERRRYIRMMSDYTHRLDWGKEKKDRVDVALNKLAPEGDENATPTMVRDVWTRMFARESDKDLAAAAAAGDGPGFPGMGTQSRQDCAVFALANASGVPYGLVAASATDLIKHAEWRPAADQAAPEQSFSRRGLNGGEVIIMAETLGQATVVPSTDFPKTLQAGHRILISVVPSDGDMDSAHEVVLAKTFKHGGETWFAVMDSNQAPDQRLYLNARELNTILWENGVVFQPEPNRTAPLLR